MRAMANSVVGFSHSRISNSVSVLSISGPPHRRDCLGFVVRNCRLGNSKGNSRCLTQVWYVCVSPAAFLSFLLQKRMLTGLCKASIWTATSSYPLQKSCAAPNSALLPLDGPKISFLATRVLTSRRSASLFKLTLYICYCRKW